MLSGINRRMQASVWRKKITSLHTKYKDYTMIVADIYIENIALCERHKNVRGCIVECGVWRGGMIAGIAEAMGENRNYYLFDSFEGLPLAKEIDGPAANAWQSDKNSPLYLENCKAEMSYAERAMKLSGTKEFKLIKGWFSESLPNYEFGEPIAILRLDGDWYDSTMDCLNNLFPKVAKGGIVIVDDYYVWDGCSRAVHDYLSKNNFPFKIRQSEVGICYIIKD